MLEFPDGKPYLPMNRQTRQRSLRGHVVSSRAASFSMVHMRTERFAVTRVRIYGTLFPYSDLGRVAIRVGG